MVAATPALKGYPGGPGLPDAADAADGAGAAAATAGPGRPEGGPSVWQRAQQAWRDAGIEWQRPAADGEPAEAGWERVQDGTAAKPARGPWHVRRAVWLAVIAAIVVAVLVLLGLLVSG